MGVTVSRAKPARKGSTAHTSCSRPVPFSDRVLIPSLYTLPFASSSQCLQEFLRNLDGPQLCPGGQGSAEPPGEQSSSPYGVEQGRSGYAPPPCLQDLLKSPSQQLRPENAAGICHGYR